MHSGVGKNGFKKSWWPHGYLFTIKCREPLMQSMPLNLWGGSVGKDSFLQAWQPEFGSQDSNGLEGENQFLKMALWSFQTHIPHPQMMKVRNLKIALKERFFNTPSLFLRQDLGIAQPSLHSQSSCFSIPSACITVCATRLAGLRNMCYCHR